MALGAEARTVAWMIGRETLLLIGIGVALGTIASYFVTKLAAGMLYATTPSDPLVFCAAVTVLLLIGLSAAWVPARRAALLDPSSALRSE
jgi:ABC-type antimicrobial peptide transport system permease subunit